MLSGSNIFTYGEAVPSLKNDCAHKLENWEYGFGTHYGATDKSYI